LLLQGDRKAYVVLGAQIVTTIINVILVIVTLHYIKSIHVVKFLSAVIFLLQPIIFNRFVKKNYNIKVDLNIKAKEEIPDRWSCLGQNIAFFIHNNTDITLLSLIAGLKIVSVYSVHTMVIFGLKNLVMAFSQVFSPKIGFSLAKGNAADIENQIDQYEFISYFISTVFFGSCICLINHFVLLYTSSITDVNYYQPVFAVLLIYSEYIYCIRNPYIAVVYGAGKFKETAISAYLEALINIVLSLLLIWLLGLTGIVIGTSVAMTYRWLYHLIYLKNNIVYRPIFKAIKRFIMSIVAIIVCYLLFNYIRWFPLNTVITWIEGGFLCIMIHLVVVIIINMLFDRKLVKEFQYRFKK
jgi:O-antigen/teichoic acid export membrane protein